MNDNIIAKNLLLNRTCLNCVAPKGKSGEVEYCSHCQNEDGYWDWRPRDENNTCEDWRNER